MAASPHTIQNIDFRDATKLKFHGVSVAPQSWDCLADSALRLRTLVELVRCAQDDSYFYLLIVADYTWNQTAVSKAVAPSRSEGLR